jgi:hypothetical protein
MYSYLNNPKSRIQSVLINRQQPDMVREVVAVRRPSPGSLFFQGEQVARENFL